VATGDLPEDGDARVAGQALPPGRRHFAQKVHQLVAWVTDAPMAGAGRTWMALSAAYAQTGLVPVLLVQARSSTEPEAGERPEFGFYRPADVGFMDQMSALTILADAWNDADDDPYLAAERAPFGPRFPGLAPAETMHLPQARLEQAASALPPAYLGLVAANRPADVPARVGWSVFGADWPGGRDARALEIGTVLRSWETRFGARLLQIGSDAILRVLVERPPRTIERARQVAAEHLAFADECHQRSGYTVAELGAVLVDAPIWTFWWD
jgi:hypothetical protein